MKIRVEKKNRSGIFCMPSDISDMIKGYSYNIK